MTASRRSGDSSARSQSVGFPAKDRSGRLEQVEEPDLGKLLRKLTNHKPKKETEKYDRHKNENRIRLQRRWTAKRRHPREHHRQPADDRTPRQRRRWRLARRSADGASEGSIASSLLSTASLRNASFGSFLRCMGRRRDMPKPAKFPETRYARYWRARAELNPTTRAKPLQRHARLRAGRTSTKCASSPAWA